MSELKYWLILVSILARTLENEANSLISYESFSDYYKHEL
jgi:hypothetical protein